jgi:hypothetical protein
MRLCDAIGTRPTRDVARRHVGCSARSQVLEFATALNEAFQEDGQ